MSYKDQLYHRDREQHWRTMAELASDPDIRRRHQELAELTPVVPSNIPEWPTRAASSARC